MADRQLRAEFRFHQPGQRQIQIVAAQQQVLADGRARKFDAVAIAMHFDQREIAGAAADIAHQHQLPVEKALLRLRQMIGDPRIKRGRRLFHQREFFDSSGMRGLHGQLARLFVERSRDGQHHVLRCQRRVGMRLVPGIANVRQDRGGNIHRRKHTPAFLRVPREDFGGAIHFGIRKPRFRRMYRFRRHQRSLLASIRADVGLIAQEQERRQRPARFHLARRDILRDGQHLDLRIVRQLSVNLWNVGEGGIGGAEVDADVHFCERACRLFNFHFGRGDHGRIRAGRERRQVDFLGLPALVPQQAAGCFAAGRHVTQ